MSSETASAPAIPGEAPGSVADSSTAPSTTVPEPPSESFDTNDQENLTPAEPKTDSTPAVPTSDQPPKQDPDAETAAAGTASEAAPAPSAPGVEAGATPTSTKKGKRRSSVLPDPKGKKGKKREVVLNLDCKPGDFYFARMKGHPEWPAVIADEEMLPESILGSRPVTARRPDYTYREDIQDGGKNAKDRTYPVMFLGTNEFAWMVNSDLRKLEPEDVADLSNIKLNKKGLQEAYEVAQKQHSLEHFKNILFKFEKARAEEERLYAEKLAAAEEKEAKRAAKAKADSKEKKGKRKSTATVDGEDVEMGDNEAGAAKATKKRKKSGVETDGEEKPAKTQKIKLNSTKSTNGDSATKTKSKSKPPKSKPSNKEEPQLSEAEQKEKKNNNVFYLRHRLQKGFLQNKAPEEAEMEAMAQFFETLQQYKVLEADIIRKTKIHKVLRAILKLDIVPLDDKYNFKKQSSDLLEGWQKTLADEEGGTPNGAKSEAPAASTEDTKSSEATPKATTLPNPTEPAATKAEEPAAVAEPPAAPVEAAAPGNEAKDEATDGDVSMNDAKPAEPAAASVDVANSTTQPIPSA